MQTHRGFIKHGLWRKQKVVGWEMGGNGRRYTVIGRNYCPSLDWKDLVCETMNTSYVVVQNALRCCNKGYNERLPPLMQPGKE